ncbi:hypothetical protein GCM10009679_01420 [Saccharothrix algeriensis]|uniref:t-SNARE coiled-coil homology domain-containing protein n=1 Tax=Catellatospora bangladeshensis TaxID=310355 RepID=A0A8J3NIQ1_9ACTN|nr:hypothetical protein Cba03nite_20000 [Catellatospora bangladeshensis]
MTLRQRVDLLEAAHYDTRRRQIEAEDQTALLRGAINEFSADLRAHRQECTERFNQIDQRFDGIDQRFDRIDQRFDRMDQRLDGMDQRFDGMDKQFNGVDQRFEGIEGMLRQILTVVTLQAGPEVARQGVATPAS